MGELLGMLALLATGAVVVIVLLTAVLVREALHPPRRTAAWAIARSLPCDPGDLGLAFEEWTLDRPDGAALPVWEVDTARDGSGTPPEVPLAAVFVHGWGQSRIGMLLRCGPWREHCDRMVFYDLRGHGDAGGPGGIDRSRLGHDEENDLLELLDRLGPSRFILIGFSMGAVIALHAAARDERGQGRIAAVLAYGPYADFHTSLRGRLRLTGLPARPLTDLAMLWLRARGIRHRELLEDVSNLACPVVVVHGRDDIVAPFSHAERIVDAAADGALHAIDEAGHRDLHLHDPETQVDLVRALVGRVTSTARSSPGR